MDKTDVLIFDVGMGQSVFVHPHKSPYYGMLVDCGNVEDFNPIDFLIKTKYIGNALNDLTLTNYDQDHFSGLPYLRSKVSITSVCFPKNLNSAEIKNLKEKPYSNALEHTCYIRDTYTNPALQHIPPYTKRVFHLEKTHLENPNANNLSQVVFIEQYGTTICVSGDLEEKGWKTLLEKQPDIKIWLAKTNIFIASHHGRNNGYYPDIFNYCKPECIVISDKGIIHDTQKDMASVYGNHIQGSGIIFDGNSVNRRKVLTTRDSGHIYIQLFPNGIRNYSCFSHE
jgi:beta-lactamase superfamily II metal-dependent hydrolase